MNTKLNIQRLLIVGLTFLLSACATTGSVSIQSGQHALRMLQHVAVESLPAGKRLISENGRNFYSNYFIPKKSSPKFWTPLTKKTKERFYASISIHGNERPYKITFSVIKEVLTRQTGLETFREVGRSEAAAKLLSNYYLENLEKSLKERNFVDDFRVF